MRTWIITVSSITDIITNSSSETFVIPYRTIVPKVYKLIDSIFIASGIETRARDIVKIEIVQNSYGNESFDTLKVTCLDKNASNIVDTLEQILNGFYAQEISDY